MSEIRLSEMMRRATALMTAAHAGITDHGGMPYYLHPLRVSTYTRMTARWCGLEDDYTIGLAVVAALLHDTVEDTWMSLSTLRDAEMPFLVVDAVKHLSKSKGQTREEYWDQVNEGSETNPIVRPVKWADYIDHTDPIRRAALAQSGRDYFTEKYTKGASWMKFSPSPFEWWENQSGLYLPPPSTS